MRATITFSPSYHHGATVTTTTVLLVAAYMAAYARGPHQPPHHSRYRQSLGRP